MLQLISQYLPYAALLIACAIAAVTDIRSRKIPNAIPASLLAAALIFRAMHGPMEILIALGLVAAVLVVGFIAFSFSMLGGGDIKLLAAGAAFLPPKECVYFFLFTAVGGGILALVTAARTKTLKKTILGSLTILHGLQVDHKTRVMPQTKTQLPYAIAITFGAVTLTVMHTFNLSSLRIF